MKTVAYHFTPTRVTVTINTVTNVGKDVGKWEPSYIARKNVKGTILLTKFGNFLRS